MGFTTLGLLALLLSLLADWISQIREDLGSLLQTGIIPGHILSYRCILFLPGQSELLSG
jgi:hypothetical protein